METIKLILKSEPVFEQIKDFYDIGHQKTSDFYLYEGIYFIQQPDGYFYCYYGNEKEYQTGNLKEMLNWIVDCNSEND